MRIPTGAALAALLLAVGAGAQASHLVQQHAGHPIEAASRAQERASRGWEGSLAVQERVGRVAEIPAVAVGSAFTGIGILSRNEAGLIASAHSERFRNLVRARYQVLELIDGFAAVRGELVAVDPTPGAIETARRRGFRVIGDETIEGIETRYVTLSVPAGKSLKRALSDLQRLAPGTEFTANHIHVQSGSALKPARAQYETCRLDEGQRTCDQDHQKQACGDGVLCKLT